MASGKRGLCEGDLYHVTIRGVGRQLIFEDDADRESMKRRLHELKDDLQIEIHAWCFMENHVHLLLRGPMERISAFMQRLQAGYARYFNKKHDRVGTLFQGRFSSTPIETDEQLLSVVSYIHRNPVEVSKNFESPWSSYVEYIGSPDLASTSFVMNAFGDPEAFVAFHQNGFVNAPRKPQGRSQLSESQAKAILSAVLGDLNPYDIRALGKAERNAILRRLKEAGLSIRQIERATSIGRGIIARASNVTIPRRNCHILEVS